MRYVTGFAINKGTVDAVGAITSTKISPAQWYYASFQASFVGTTNAGTLQLQFSNDNPAGNSEENFTPINWTNVPGSTATATVTAAASVAVYPPQNFVGRWYRVVYTSTTSGGSFQVTYCAVSP